MHASKRTLGLLLTLFNSTIVFIALFISGCQDVGKDTKVLDSSYSLPQDFEQQIDNLIKEYLDLEIFSGVVFVADNGNPVFHKAYGVADRESGRMVQQNTLFDIGSMNKTFTAIVLKQLAAEGQLELSDPLNQYINGFSDPRAHQITLAHLLEHRSGFGDYHTPGYFELPLNERRLQAIVERAKDMTLEFDPGTDEAYSNLGYVILGDVIEKVTGRSYFENVRQRIVEPLGLSETYLENFDGLENRMAQGYYYSPLGILEVSAPLQDVPNPDGGFLSTASDIFKFYHSYYYGNVLLDKATQAEDPLFKYIKTLPEGKPIGAAGGFEGFNSVLLQLIKEDLTVVVLANMDEPVAERIGSDILSVYRGEVPNKPSLPAVQNVRLNYEEHGIDYIRANFEDLTVNFHPTDPRDWILNTLGYAYLYEAEDVETALAFFELNTELFPTAANCYDSYGEALMVKGNLKGAATAYKKALELNPELESAITALRDIEKQ